MATVTLRPTSASGTSWSNTANIYDGDDSTSGTVSVSSSNYSSRTLTCNFDTSSIPSGATINSATLTIISKQSSSTSSRRITVRCAVNGGSTYAINTQLTTTSSTTLTGDITSDMSSLSTVVVTGYRSSTTSTTFTVYEIYIDVDYTEGSSSGGSGSTTTSNIYLGDTKITDLYLGTTRIIKAYLGNFLLYSYDAGGSEGEEDSPAGLLGDLRTRTIDNIWTSDGVQPTITTTENSIVITSNANGGVDYYITAPSTTTVYTLTLTSVSGSAWIEIYELDGNGNIVDEDNAITEGDGTSYTFTGCVQYDIGFCSVNGSTCKFEGIYLSSN